MEKKKKKRVPSECPFHGNTDEIAKAYANDGIVLNKITLLAAMGEVICLAVDEISQNC